jgi:hypothetical protein
MAMPELKVRKAKPSAVSHDNSAIAAAAEDVCVLLPAMDARSEERGEGKVDLVRDESLNPAA